MANKRKRTRQRRAVATAPAAPAKTAPVSAPARAVKAKAVRAEKPRAAAVSAPAVKLDPAAVIGAGVVGLVAFVIYALTVQPSVPTGDSGELIAAAYVLGVGHPPGYPLYMMLGHLVTLLPGGSPAERMNLFSGLTDAVAVAIVFLVIYRLVARSRDGATGAANRWLPLVAAAVGALLLAFSTLFWAYSVVAEVFPLNNLFAALLLLIGLEWCRNPERTRLLALWMFVLGLGLCDQQTIVLIVPGFVALAWLGWKQRSGPEWRPSLARLLAFGGVALLAATFVFASWFAVLSVLLFAASLGFAWAYLRSSRARVSTLLPPREIWIAIAAFIAGLLPQIYLPIASSADPKMDWGHPTSLQSFYDLIARKNYGSLSLTVGGKPGTLSQNMSLLFGDLLHGFVYVGLALALLGLWWAWRNGRRSEGLALATAFLVAGPLFMAYTNTAYPDQLTMGIIARFYILPSIPLAVAAGLGAWWLLRAAGTMRLPVVGARVATALVAAALLAAPAASAVAHYSTDDQSGNNVALNYGNDLLAPLKPNALLLMRSDQNYDEVSYVQNVEHYRTDVVALDVELLKIPSYVAQARREHPNVLIPFPTYDDGVHYSLNTMVQANLTERPVYYIGVMKEKKFGKPFDLLYDGLARELVPKGSAPDEYALLAQNPERFAHLHYPPKTYPKTSWEGAAIGTNYAYVAFYLGYAIQTDDQGKDLALAEKMYRTAIRLLPSLAQAYKNLGLILHNNGGDPKEVIALWTKYLRLAPHDSQAPAIRQVLEQLEATQKK